MSESHWVNIALKDRLDRIHILKAKEGDNLAAHMRKMYIPRDAVVVYVNGEIINETSYLVSRKDKIVLDMVRAYQLPEYCKTLQLWDQEHNVPPTETSQKTAAETFYTKQILWFNDNGIADLRQTHFSKKEFPSWVDDTFVSGILEKALLKDGDRVLLALSGGRDSLALLYLLRRNADRLPNIELVGVNVAPSAASRRDIEVAEEAMKGLGLEELHILDETYVNETFSFKNGVLSAYESALQNGGRGRSIATFHCVMRANVERFARENGFKNLAFGYHHEDLFTSVFRSNTLGVLFGESVQTKTWGDFTMVSPLWPITKKELTLYLHVVADPSHVKQGSPSDYDRGDHNRDINYFMTDLLSSVYPGLGFSFFESLEELYKTYQPKSPKYHQCSNCGITYNDRFLQGSLIDENYCEPCLYFIDLGEIAKIRSVKAVPDRDLKKHGNLG